ncbi:MAG: serine hydrolase domain-containing protein [Putridiphycobacter sp.]
MKRLILFGGILLSFWSCQQEKNNPTESNPQQENITDEDLAQLTPEQQFNQHLVVELPALLQQNIDSLAQWVNATKVGGLILTDWNLDSIQALHLNLDSTATIQPLIMDNFWDRMAVNPYRFEEINRNLTELKYQQFLVQSGINLVDFNGFFDTLSRAKEFLTLEHKFPKGKPTDYLDFINAITNSSSVVQIEMTDLDSINYEGIKAQYNFKGIFISQPKDVENAINSGADLVIVNGLDQIGTHKLVQTEITKKSTKNLLELKTQINHPSKTQPASQLLKFSKLNFQQKGSALLQNEKNLIPVKSLKFKKLNKYTPTEIKKVTQSSGTKYLVLPDTLNQEVLQNFSKVKPKDKLIVCFSNPSYYSTLKELPQLVFVPNIQPFNRSILEEQLKGNLSFSADFILDKDLIKGQKITSTKLSRTPPEFVGINSKKLRQVDYLVRNAMNGRAFPGCQVLVAKQGSIIFDKSYGHHSYKRQITTKANSVYDLASITKIVSTTLMGMKLYEMGLYNLNDSINIFFPDSLKDYLDYPSTIKDITFQELFIHKSGLPAGFPILKYMQYTNEQIQRYDLYYCDFNDTLYNVQVAENFYMENVYQDSMWLQFHKLWLDKEKPYKYSDVNMNLLYFLFRSIIENNPKTFDFNERKKKLEGRNLYVEYLYKTFYKPLEMNSTMYKPLQKINKNRIVPTENESYWRKQLLQGYVHDPNSALHGGVAGNAGIFSTTNDMVKLLQMWVNGGVYEGKRYLKLETINLFTSTQPNSHRGLGFNKRTLDNAAYAMADSASVNTYGHTGFTGTCFWIDPDNEMVYVFLSNRVHPKVNKRIYQYALRKNVHQVFYDAIMLE